MKLSDSTMGPRCVQAENALVRLCIAQAHLSCRCFHSNLVCLISWN